MLAPHTARCYKVTASIFTALLILSGQQTQATDPTYSEVFVSGENDYHLIRTPQILATRDKTLLVFAQGRDGHHDQSGNDILLKRSSDGGNTWSNLKVIAEDGKNSLNSVCVLQLAGSGRMLGDDERPAAKALFAPLYLEVVDALREQGEAPQ